MRTKTLLIAAAALAAGILVSSAQTYSQNVVGYYNVPIPAGTFYIVGNQFDVGVSNGLNEMFAGGLMSDVNGATNTAVYIWLPGQVFAGPYQYFSAADAAADQSGSTYANGAGFYDGSGNYITTIIPPGSGVFLQNLAPGTITPTVVGSVAQGTNLVSMIGTASIGALNLISSPIPVSTNVASGPITYVGTSDVNGVYNDQIYIWNPLTAVFSSYQYFNAADAAADQSGSTYANGAGFYDGSGNYQTTTVSPTVGTGFFLLHYGPNGDGTSETWTNIFTVQ
ncbi:MAG: hypothetical protein ACLQUR_01465 [Limisphaerales bacterium]